MWIDTFFCIYISEYNDIFYTIVPIDENANRDGATANGDHGIPLALITFWKHEGGKADKFMPHKMAGHLGYSKRAFIFFYAFSKTNSQTFYFQTH